METIEEWYANKTHRTVEELDEYDLCVCNVVREYIATHSIDACDDCGEEL